MRRLTACRQDLRSYYSFQSSMIIFWPERLTTSFCRSRIPSSFIISAGITTDRLRCPTRVTLRIYFSITCSMTRPAPCYVACYVIWDNPKFVNYFQRTFLEASSPEVGTASRKITINYLQNYEIKLDLVQIEP